MQTTLRINNTTYRQAKAKSSELGLSLTRFVEEAVEERLARLEQRHPPSRMALPISSVSGPPMSDQTLRQRIANADIEDDLSRLN